MIQVSKSTLGKEETEAIRRVIEDSGYLGMGMEVSLFENELEKYINNSEFKCICVSSGTAALHLAIEAVTNPGDEILVQSFTFVATIQAITAARCIPVFCDINIENATINLEDAEKRLSNRTKVILPVHIASNPGNLKSVYDFAHKYKLRVIEDAAQAFGCRYEGRKIGAQGDIVCFSFDPIKNITCGEGGAVFTSDLKVAQKIRDSSLLGINNDFKRKLPKGQNGNFEIESQGYRYHLNNISASIGRVQLRKLDSVFTPQRKFLANLYCELLSSNSKIGLLNSDFSEIIPHIFLIRILDGQRDFLKEALREEGIETLIHYKPNHHHKFFGQTDVELPDTNLLYKQILTLPLHPDLSENDIRHICSITNSIIK